MKCLFFIYSFLSISVSILCAQQPKELSLANTNIRIVWELSNEGWKIKILAVKKGYNWIKSENPSGEYTALYSAEKPNLKPSQTFKTITAVEFPEPVYHKQLKGKWDESTNDVSLNTAGKAYHFFPSRAYKKSSINSISFTHITDIGTVVSVWTLDPESPTDVLVKQTLYAEKVGYYSIACPFYPHVPLEVVPKQYMDIYAGKVSGDELLYRAMVSQLDGSVEDNE